MPRIDLGYGQLGNQTLTPQRGAPDVSGLNQEADALSRLAQTGAKTYAEIQQNRENMQMAKASTEFAKEIESKEFEFRHEDTDFSTQDQRYQEYVQERYQEYEKKFKNPAMFNQFKQNTDKFVFDKGLSIKSNALKNNALEQQSILTSTLNDISGIAIRGDQEQFDESVARGDGLIEHAFEIGVLDTSEKEKFTQTFKNGLSRGKVRQDITLDPVNALQNIRDNKYANLSAEEQSQFESMALSKISQNKNKASAEAIKQAKELVSDGIKTYKRNEVVTEEEYQAIAVAAELVGMQEELSNARAGAFYITLPFDERDKIRSDSVMQGVQNVELRETLDWVENEIDNGLKKDSYQYAVDTKVIDNIPLNFNIESQNDIAELSLAIAKRSEQAAYLEKYQYGKPVSILTENEAEFLVRMLPDLSPQRKTVLAMSLGSNKKVWSQLDEKNAGLFAMTGAIGDARVMENVFKGQQMIADGLADNMSKNDYISAFNDYVSDVYVGEDRKNMLDASLAYYTATHNKNLIEKGKPAIGVFDTSEFEDAIEAVSGGIGTINGKKVELPRGVDQDDFQDFVDNMSNETITENGGVWGMSSDVARKKIENGVIKSMQGGKYAVLVSAPNTPEGTAILMSSKNPAEPFLFSFDEDIFKRDQELNKPVSRRQSRQAR